MIDDELKRAFAAGHRLPALRPGSSPVVVHGGGPQISAMLDRLGIASEFRGGLRVTTPEAMDVVRMVLVGQVGRELVGLINAHGPLAVGLSGEDAGLFTAGAAAPSSTASRSTSAWSATSSRSTPAPCSTCIDAGRIPVVSTVAAGRRRPGATTSTPTPRPPRSPSRSAPRSSSCSPTSRASTPTGRTARRCCRRIGAAELARAAARAGVGHGARRWRPACAPSAAACRRRT